MIVTDEMVEWALEGVELPCDIHLPPNTYIRKGVAISVAIDAIFRREGRPDEDTRFPRPPVPDDVAGVVDEIFDAVSVYLSDPVSGEVAREAIASALATASTGEREEYVLRKRGYFYRPGSAGYTASIHEAGRYTGSAAHAHAANAEGVTAHHESEFLPTPPAEAGKVEAKPVAWQWRAWQDGNPYTKWVPDGYGDRAGWEALAKRSPAKYRIETRSLYSAATVAKLTKERDKARALAGLGCDAASGGPHSIIKQGSYTFCHVCGETIKSPTMTERCRAAEARAEALEKDKAQLAEALRAVVEDFWDCEAAHDKPVHEAREAARSALATIDAALGEMAHDA